jgi:hypothetical protein
VGQLSTDGIAEVTGEVGVDAGAGVDAGVGVAFGVNIVVGSGVSSGAAVGLPQPTAKDAIIKRQANRQANLANLVEIYLHWGVTELQTDYRLRHNIHCKVEIIRIPFYITL